MPRHCKTKLVGLALVLTLGGAWLLAGNPPSQAERRSALNKLHEQGNFKEAYEGLRKLTLDPGADKLLVGKDMDLAVNSLIRLGRVDEIDEYREDVIQVHQKNWRLLFAAAESYHSLEHYGYLTAGKFYRGHKRGGAKYVNVFPRDRIRALQLMDQARDVTAGDNDKLAVGSFHLAFAKMFMNEPWRMQYLSDLTKLPDYEDGWYGYTNHTGAPVDAQGKPVFHHMPKGYKEAQSDGQRWRWLLAETAKIDPNRLSETDIIFADFLRGQFGVQTMAYYGYRFGGDEQGDDKTGTYALHTLGEDETIARLASGIKRFKLPDEFNFIKVYSRVADREKSAWGERSLDTLGGEFENRRQYVRAAEIFKRGIADYGVGKDNSRQNRLDQIIGNWGRFESGRNQPMGSKAVVDFRFRNGNKVSFEAHAVNVGKLLDDVKAYLVASPNQIDYNQINIGNIGYRLVEKGENQYLGAKVAAWDVDLKPRKGHVDDRITVETPLVKPGAYLIKAQMKDGNVSRTIIWVSDTILLKKQLDNQAYIFAADAVTGAPVPNADVEFFGWRQEQVKPNTNQYRTITTRFTQPTDLNGQVILGPDKLPNNFQWLITARKDKAGQEQHDRFAYLGFTNVWYNRIYDPEYNHVKVFAITDRPVYRPEQTAQFKLWIEHAKYDQKDVSSFAFQNFTLRFNNPRGEKIIEKEYTTDEYGGIAGEFPLSKGAMLGVYNFHIINKEKIHGGGSFRVEEYKKPEFEVTVEAPKEPVKLGETVLATIQAKYYFGAPVTSAKVKYTVTRTPHTARWYPAGRWDWFYGPGYWWFAPDSDWYPGFADWCGCRRPIPSWWGWRNPRPEVVLENEVPIGPDGTVKVAIDTMPAKELHGNQDHQYSITAEVVDESRRTIVGQGNVLVSRKPFQIYTWLDRGHYRVGDTILAQFSAQTLDKKPVEGKGELTLFSISYDDKNQPVEKAIEKWSVDTNVEGKARQQIKAAKAGQYRLSYKLTDAKNNTIEGGYLFLIRGEGFTAKNFRFNDIELVTDKREYQPGEKVKILVNTNKPDSTVLLFLRPTSGVYLPPSILRLKGKSFEEDVAVIVKDMPNFFVEAVTVADGRVHSEMREVVVPPVKRVVSVEIQPSQVEYKPGQKATVKLKLTDYDQKPFVGSTVVSVYDRSVEYIAGPNVPEIKSFFWQWRRQHYPQTENSLSHWMGNLLKRGEIGMSNLGIFGETVIEELGKSEKRKDLQEAQQNGAAFGGRGAGAPNAAPGQYAADGLRRQFREGEQSDRDAKSNGGGGDNLKVPTVRKNFADTAFWTAALTTDKDGLAEVNFTMPENLSAWKIRVWALGHGTRVGEGETIVTTKKDLIVRLQAPRFFTQKDEVVLSANVHNYHKKDKKILVTLETEGGTLGTLGNQSEEVVVKAGGEKRVDWRVKVQNEGTAVIRVKAQTDDDADAMEMRFPCYVHGMLKMESFTGVIRTKQTEALVTFNVPKERRINQTALEVRYSPTLAGAMVDALPYMVDYPYGCTEQTLNRFLPTVITQKVLKDMKLDLKEIAKHQTNLNSQEIGNDKERIKQWKRFKINPVFDEDEVKRMAQAGVDALAGMQIGDGGWGWFSGFGERSYPHTTAIVVHGLQLAKENKVELPNGMLERGIAWLKAYQEEELRKLQNAPTKTKPYKEHADNIDALVYMVLVDGGIVQNDMRDFIYRDRNHIAVYAKAMFGLALHKQQDQEKLAMIMRNIEQYLVQDDENQTAYLRLPADNCWWCWHGSDTEANAYYLKLLSLTNAKDERASRLVKYLLNNRRHATYWSSTRDTAVCIEAMADYLKNSGEDRPDMTVEVWLDGKKRKEVKIDASNLFTFDNKLILVGDAVEDGQHKLELKRRGSGPVYFNAYLTNFTLEDHITKAGLEVKVNRKYYKLTRADAKVKVSGSKGQVLDQKVIKYDRAELQNLAELKSGDLVEIELEIDSKNDYEYLIFEDPKAAGFEPVAIRSGYVYEGLSAYMEMRDEKVCFFVRALPRGKHSLSYRMRAEIPGNFAALPTRAEAMYAPELRGNSDEIRVIIRD